ncbi:5'3'-deoxyribonucleotidase, cytosolic type [Hondaea fermentalgiana]|uniref:5'3'-deoxyribonucleotidase, cytosolic type n=1 Tax=Hondaea fermentalgiana TaxID=2315210 RepID=A0A2R5G7P9_9STRA|nr:5'3'-deoxyribonucleotidase, cytosolic type [Hondaea fermentalgiana]|eukprot:GBG24503.1 5'3'-deoxyribonucleotidase, cytosolic type [Hondaea fermentalgiana]
MLQVSGWFRLAAALTLASALGSDGVHGQATFGPRYLVKVQNESAANLAGTLQTLHEGEDPVLADLASVSDDGLANFVDLGFSLPFYGNSRVRTVGVDANGLISLDAFVPETYPCKRTYATSLGGSGSSSCLGMTNFSNVIGVFATDLWPGDLEAATAGEPDTHIYTWTSDGMFSVLWERTKFYDPTGLADTYSEAATIKSTKLTFALTLTRDGRLRFWYESLLDITTLFLGERGLFAGLRGPDRLDASAAGEQTAEELDAQAAWNSLLYSNPAAEAVGSFLDPVDVVSGATVDMCLVPDWNLETLEEETICLVPSLADGGSSIELVVPEALLGCAQVNGIELYCRVTGDPDEAASISEDGVVTCPLASGPLSSTDEVNITLVFKGADNAAERVVSSTFCSTLSGPTLDYLTDASPCAADATGEPAVRDCAGVCGGMSVLDREGSCCASDAIGCNGVCALAEYVVAAKRILSGVSTSASNQKTCCAADTVDCDGVCQGCTCDSCEREEEAFALLIASMEEQNQPDGPHAPRPALLAALEMPHKHADAAPSKRTRRQVVDEETSRTGEAKTSQEAATLQDGTRSAQVRPEQLEDADAGRRGEDEDEDGLTDAGEGMTPGQDITVLVDMYVDGVLCDFDIAVKTAFQKMFPEHPELDLSRDRKCFYMSDNYGALLGESAAASAKTITERRGFFANLPAIPGGVDAVRAMDSIPGINVILCTSPLSNYQYVLQEKFAWVEKHLGKPWIKKIVLTKDKTVVNGRILIDDRPEIKGSVHPPPWEHVLFAQPYNAHIRGKRRLASWHGDDWRRLIISLLEPKSSAKAARMSLHCSGVLGGSSVAH